MRRTTRFHEGALESVGSPPHALPGKAKRLRWEERTGQSDEPDSVC